MNRKIAALSVLFVLFFTYGFSQDTPKTKMFKLGLKVVPTFSWIKSNTKDVVKTGSRIGLSYGLIGDFYFTENYGFSTGIDVSYNGGKFDDTAYNNDMNKYEFQKSTYDYEVERINQSTKQIQSQDKSLELKMKQLDTEHNAVQTEMEAVQKVLQKNIEGSFKTFA